MKTVRQFLSATAQCVLASFAFILLCLALPATAQTVTTLTLVTGTGGEVGAHSKQAIVNGNPAIAYYAVTDKKLLYVRALDANGTSWSVPLVVDAVGDVGQFLSLAVVNGNPAISYFDASNLDLKYVRATDANGTTWGTPQVVESAGEVGSHTSLAVVNGNPAISYLDGYLVGSFDLKYVHANDANGAAWGTPVTVDSTGNVGTYTCLIVINGNPAISYRDGGNNDLKYARASDVNGAAWSAPLVLDSTASVGGHTSLAVVNGNPAISYHGGSLDLKYVRATDVNGSAWGASQTISSLNSVGAYNSLKVVNGNPAISYSHGSNRVPMYVRATNANGSSWGTPVVVEAYTGSTVGAHSWLLVVNGNPAICCQDSSNGDLKYVRASDVSGATWGAMQTVEAGTNTGLSGDYTSQCMVTGTPAICYRDGGKTLKYIRATNALGTAWGSPVTVDTSGRVSRYYSMTVINGNPAISYCDDTNADLMYVRASDANGTTWGTPQVVDSTYYGTHTSLAEVNGRPAISYHIPSTYDLKYVRANDANGTSWGTPQTLDDFNETGLYTSLKVVNGNPAISYYDEFTGDLNYMRANDASGAAWGAPQVVDSTGNVGKYTSLAVVDGHPAISYYDATNRDLKYVRASNANGTAWGTPLVLDSTGIVGGHPSLVVVRGRPAISYVDGNFEVDPATNLKLKYVQANDASGTAWSTPQTLDGISSVGQYNSLALFNGNPAISYYDATHSDLKWLIMVYPPDADSDGLLDSWELAYWPTTTGHSALDDWDKDGYSELLELALGLNPTLTNPGAIPGVTQEGGYLTMTLTKQPGVTYQVQTAGTLVPAQPDSFSAASTTVLINNATTLKARDNVLISSGARRFIRVQVTAAP